MPLVRIHLMQGKPVQFSRRVSEIVYQTMEEKLFIPAKDNFQTSLVHVPYKGGGPAAIALMSGEISMIRTRPVASSLNASSRPDTTTSITGRAKTNRSSERVPVSRAAMVMTELLRRQASCCSSRAR